MTRKIVLSSNFRKEFRRFSKNNEKRQRAIEQTIRLLEVDPFASLLETHKLLGKLARCLACSCGFDCRIVFRIETDAETDTQLVVLLGIGSHSDVY